MSSLANFQGPVVKNPPAYGRASRSGQPFQCPNSKHPFTQNPLHPTTHQCQPQFRHNIHQPNSKPPNDPNPKHSHAHTPLTNNDNNGHVSTTNSTINSLHIEHHQPQQQSTSLSPLPQHEQTLLQPPTAHSLLQHLGNETDHHQLLQQLDMMTD